MVITAIRRFFHRHPITDEARMRESIARDNARGTSLEGNPSLYFKRPERIWMRTNVLRNDGDIS